MIGSGPGAIRFHSIPTEKVTGSLLADVGVTGTGRGATFQPAGEVVGDIASVVAEVSADGRGEGAAVVPLGGQVVDLGVGGAVGLGVVDEGGEAVAGVGADGAFGDHARDGGCGYSCYHASGNVGGDDAQVLVEFVVLARVAGEEAIVVLHETRVEDGAFVGGDHGGWDPDTARGLVEDDGQNETVVDAEALSDLLDGVAHDVDLILGHGGYVILGTGGPEVVFVVLEPALV
nr:hypothetical protein CFP56_75860 [Quercus suber]